MLPHNLSTQESETGGPEQDSVSEKEKEGGERKLRDTEA